MIIVIRPGTKEEEIQELIDRVEMMGVGVHRIKGTEMSILGLIGDTSRVSRDELISNRIVQNVMHVQEPYKKANRMFHPHDTVVDVAGRKIGGEEIIVIAGPCSVESEEQLVSIAKDVKKSGAKFLRGGAYKPRSSPYSFQGLGVEGLELLKIAKAETGLPIVSEIMTLDTLPIFEESVDIIQVGARNMQNFGMLKELGKINKPILLKRGLSATIEELLMATEYIMVGGNENIILCERGIRTFETYTRNTLDLSAIPIIKKRSHLPILVDPSHATGDSELVLPLSRAAIAAGADGLMIEVHNNPSCALCDGKQSLNPSAFDELMKIIKPFAALMGRSMGAVQ